MREVERYITGRLEPAELCHGGPASDMTRKVAVVLASDYDALAAENARLAREVKNDAIAYRAVLERQDELCAERDAARAQLAAIQGGMGEVVEVVAWRIEHPAKQWKVYEQRQDWAYQEYGHIKYEVQDLMTVAQHQRIVAALAASTGQEVKL